MRISDWRARRDSNSQPSDPKSDALSIELRTPGSILNLVHDGIRPSETGGTGLRRLLHVRLENRINRRLTRVISVLSVVGIAAATIPVAIAVSRSDTAETQTDSSAIEVSPMVSAPENVSATWTRPSTHTNSPFLFYQVEFSEGVAGLDAADFTHSGSLRNCTFTPSKGELATEQTLDSFFAEYPRLYNVMVVCTGLGSFTPSITGTVVVNVPGWDVREDGPLPSVPVVNETIDVDRRIDVVTDPILTVTKTGGGDGYVSSTTSSFQCGELCSAAYTRSIYGTNWPVTLRAMPYPGSMFTGWSGACTGTSTCRLTMSASRSVTATFVPAGGVLLQKFGRGSVASSPAGITCPLTSTNCTTWHRDGTTLVLTATPARASGTTPASRFVGWAGACSGTGTCTITVDAEANPIPLYAIFQ